jgi:hypothetical protein
MIRLRKERQQTGGKKWKRNRKKKQRRSLIPSAPSIPSKFDERWDKKPISEKLETSFLCSTTRFEKKKNANPGPGQYYLASSNFKDAKKGRSVSARGYTSLISLDPRFSDLKELEAKSLPGPASYMPDVAVMKPSAMKIDFANHRTSGNKRKPTDFATPGPGHYFMGGKVKSHSDLGAASFKFTARKESDVLLQQDTHVAVGTYEVAKSLDYIEKLGKEARKGKDFPDHIFSSTAYRLAPIVVSEAPAPGYYDCEPYISHDMFQPSSMFNNNLDRFGNSNNVQIYRDKTPGPAYYCQENPNSKSVGGAVASFSSTCGRFGEDGSKELNPGPQTYRPQHVSRKSFHMNRHCCWL